MNVYHISMSISNLMTTLVNLKMGFYHHSIDVINIVINYNHH